MGVYEALGGIVNTRQNYWHDRILDLPGEEPPPDHGHFSEERLDLLVGYPSSCRVVSCERDSHSDERIVVGVLCEDGSKLYKQLPHELFGEEGKVHGGAFCRAWTRPRTTLLQL